MSNPTLYRALPLVAALSCLLNACSLTPGYQRPHSPLPADDSWTADAVDIVADTHWWRQFGSAELDALMTRAAAGNLDLRAAVARIDEVRATARISSAPLLPSAGVSAQTSHARQEAGADWQTTDADSVQVSVGYELDLWGGNRAARQAALARLDASVWDRTAVELSLQAQVANQYFQWLAYREQLDIARANLAAADQLLALVQIRYDAGAATALELAQQKTTRLSIAGTLPTLEQNLAVTARALGVLLGGDAQAPALSSQRLAELTLPRSQPGLPSALLEQRPEIRVAEANLVAAHADVAAARAALLPSLELSLAGGVSGALTGGSSQFASLAAALSQTLFDGGAQRAQVAAAQASERQLSANYLQAVLSAVQDVGNALDSQRLGAERRRIADQTAEQASETLRLARIRFDAGQVDLLELLDAQRTQLSAQSDQVDARLAEFNAATALFLALGGAWPGVDNPS